MQAGGRGHPSLDAQAPAPAPTHSFAHGGARTTTHRVWQCLTTAPTEGGEVRGEQIPKSQRRMPAPMPTAQRPRPGCCRRPPAGGRDLSRRLPRSAPSARARGVSVGAGRGPRAAHARTAKLLRPFRPRGATRARLPRAGPKGAAIAASGKGGAASSTGLSPSPRAPRSSPPRLSALEDPRAAAA